MPFFSVIIPAHERPDWLLQAIDSVLQQSFSDFEVLVIYNDEMPFTHTSFTDPRVRIEHSRPHNRSAARNKGITLAQGKYICFLDDDDVFHPDLLASFYDTLQRIGFPSDGIVRTGLLHCMPDHQLKEGAIYQQEVHDNPIQFILGNMTSVGSCCIPSVLACSIQFDERFQYWEDTHFLLRLLHRNQLVQMPNHLYHYRYHENMGSQSKADLQSQCEANLAAISDYRQNYESQWTQWVEPNVFSRLMAKKRLMYAVRAAQLGEKKLSKVLFTQSTHDAWMTSSWKDYLSYFYYYLFV